MLNEIIDEESLTTFLSDITEQSDHRAVDYSNIAAEEYLKTCANSHWKSDMTDRYDYVCEKIQHQTESIKRRLELVSAADLLANVGHDMPRINLLSENMNRNVHPAVIGDQKPVNAGQSFEYFLHPLVEKVISRQALQLYEDEDFVYDLASNPKFVNLTPHKHLHLKDNKIKNLYLEAKRTVGYKWPNVYPWAVYYNNTFDPRLKFKGLQCSAPSLSFDVDKATTDRNVFIGIDNVTRVLEEHTLLYRLYLRSLNPLDTKTGVSNSSNCLSPWNVKHTFLFPTRGIDDVLKACNVPKESDEKATKALFSEQVLYLWLFPSEDRQEKISATTCETRKGDIGTVIKPNRSSSWEHQNLTNKLHIDMSNKTFATVNINAKAKGEKQEDKQIKRDILPEIQAYIQKHKPQQCREQLNNRSMQIFLAKSEENVDDSSKRDTDDKRREKTVRRRLVYNEEFESALSRKSMSDTNVYSTQKDECGILLEGTDRRPFQNMDLHLQMARSDDYCTSATSQAGERTHNPAWTVPPPPQPQPPNAAAMMNMRATTPSYLQMMQMREMHNQQVPSKPSLQVPPPGFPNTWARPPSQNQNPVHGAHDFSQPPMFQSQYVSNQWQVNTHPSQQTNQHPSMFRDPHQGYPQIPSYRQPLPPNPCMSNGQFRWQHHQPQQQPFNRANDGSVSMTQPMNIFRPPYPLPGQQHRQPHPFPQPRYIHPGMMHEGQGMLPPNYMGPQNQFGPPQWNRHYQQPPLHNSTNLTNNKMMFNNIVEVRHPKLVHENSGRNPANLVQIKLDKEPLQDIKHQTKINDVSTCIFANRNNEPKSEIGSLDPESKDTKLINIKELRKLFDKLATESAQKPTATEHYISHSTAPSCLCQSSPGHAALANAISNSRWTSGNPHKNVRSPHTQRNLRRVTANCVLVPSPVAKPLMSVSSTVQDNGSSNNNNCNRQSDVMASFSLDNCQTWQTSNDDTAKDLLFRPASSLKDQKESQPQVLPCFYGGSISHQNVRSTTSYCETGNKASSSNAALQFRTYRTKRGGVIQRLVTDCL